MRQVYFDMDGVLDDFHKYGLQHFPDLLREPIVHGLKLLEQVRALDNTHVTLLTALPEQIVEYLRIIKET